MESGRGLGSRSVDGRGPEGKMPSRSSDDVKIELSQNFSRSSSTIFQGSQLFLWEIFDDEVLTTVTSLASTKYSSVQTGTSSILLFRRIWIHRRVVLLWNWKILFWTVYCRKRFTRSSVDRFLGASSISSSRCSLCFDRKPSERPWSSYANIFLS